MNDLDYFAIPRSWHNSVANGLLSRDRAEARAERVLAEGVLECNVCHVKKPLTEMARDRRRILGRKPICEVCACEQNNAWRSAHRDIVQERNRADYLKRTEGICRRRRQVVM